MKRLAFVLALALALPATQAAANGHRHFNPHGNGPGCSSSNLLPVVNSQLPFLGPRHADLDPADLSCNGLAQVYSLVTRSPDMIPGHPRSRIIQVFRREGLTR